MFMDTMMYNIILYNKFIMHIALLQNHVIDLCKILKRIISNFSIDEFLKIREKQKNYETKKNDTHMVIE